MHRFYLPPDQGSIRGLSLQGREAYHAVHVLRLHRGERVTVLDGAGGERVCEVEEATREQVLLRPVEHRQIPRLPWEITLLQGIPKGRIIEDIIQKATELGVHRVVPLLTERVMTHLGDDGGETKAARWRQTAIEAIKQSGNPWLPVVATPLTPQAFLARNEPFDLAIIASLSDQPRHLREHVRSFHQAHQRLPRSVWIWIGPEGDFTPAEVDLAKTAGALPISLGRLVLRCETAAISCLAAIIHELSCPLR